MPADHKWFARLVVATAIVDAIERLDLSYPEVDDTKLKALAAARKALAAEKEQGGAAASRCTTSAAASACQAVV